MELKELNWLCKHMKNFRSSQPCTSMNFCTEFSVKHKFFHVSIVKQPNCWMGSFIQNKVSTMCKHKAFRVYSSSHYAIIFKTRCQLNYYLTGFCWILLSCISCQHFICPDSIFWFLSFPRDLSEWFFLKFCRVYRDNLGIKLVTVAFWKKLQICHNWRFICDALSNLVPNA